MPIGSTAYKTDRSRLQDQSLLFPCKRLTFEGISLIFFFEFILSLSFFVSLFAIYCYLILQVGVLRAWLDLFLFFFLGKVLIFRVTIRRSRENIVWLVFEFEDLYDLLSFLCWSWIFYYKNYVKMWFLLCACAWLLSFYHLFTFIHLLFA